MAGHQRHAIGGCPSAACHRRLDIIIQRKVTQMKTSHLALLTLAALGTAAGAQAQRRLLDAGTAFQRDALQLECPNCTNAKLGGPGSALVDELSTVSLLEARILGDTGRLDQYGIVFRRQVYVGLDKGLGALTLGQHNRQYPALSDAQGRFEDGLTGPASNLVGFSARRYDYSVKYATRKRKGVIAELAYSYGEMPDNNALNRAYGATLGYANGPVSIRLAHSRKNTSNLAPGTLLKIDTRANNSLISANLVQGPITAYAAYGHNRGAGSAPWNADNPYGALVRSVPASRSSDVLVGVSVALGPTTLMGSYIRRNAKDIGSGDANQLAFGLSYEMSTHTDVYASYAKITSTNGADYALGKAFSGANRALNLGLRHSF